MIAFRSLRGALAGAALALGLCAASAQAQDFRLAMSSPPSSMDPHFFNLFSNINVSDHMFETLVKMSPDSQPIPGLAESWRLVNETTWEFKLRRGVKFHDGSDFTAEDVAWSIDRIPLIANSPGRFDSYTKAIVSKRIIDSHTIQFTTASPYPLMLPDLTAVFIVSKKATAGALPQGLASEDFATGKGMSGTGPFKFVRFQRDDRVELERNDAYWGPKPAWARVTLRFIAADPTRVAALLSGDVDAIENVPTADLKRIRENKALNFFSKVSHRVIYFNLDQREKTPFVFDNDGKPLDKNPLRDARVRKALSLAVNRDAIRDRLMEGLSLPTANLVPSTLFGHNPTLKPVFDADQAKRLLTEAGYPNGFQLTFHGPNNRYVNDDQIMQTIAQMWARIGVRARVDAMPLATYFPRGTKKEFSVTLVGWGAQTGEASSPLRALLACENKEKGFGAINYPSYCNPKMDALLEEGLRTVDDKKRSALFQEAVKIVVDDAAFVPIHHQVTTWAAK
ncbi:MAG: ABC transporter substrate-binding protein, partial [Burkholderiales bacterium]